MDSFERNMKEIHRSSERLMSAFYYYKTLDYGPRSNDRLFGQTFSFFFFNISDFHLFIL